MNARRGSAPLRCVAALCATAWGCGGESIAPQPAADASADAAWPDGGWPDVPDAQTADAPAKASDVAAADVPEPPLEASPCSDLHAGTVTGFMVDGVEREFILTLPPGATAAGGRWPVVFNWHGLGDTAANMDMLLSGQVGNATMPFVLVTPESTHLGPGTTPVGLDWDEIRVTTPNREARLFDAVLACVDARWGVDRDRVYTVGFSAGGIMSDLLATLRGEQLAAVATFSGGYFANPDNTDTLGPFRTFVSWPELATRNAYTQLFMYGGTRDTFSLVVTTAHFDQFARNDATFLRAMGHDTIACNHNGGHTIPSRIMGPQLVEFFAAHRRGAGPSPWSAGLPGDFPSYCEFQGRGAI